MGGEDLLESMADEIRHAARAAGATPEQAERVAQLSVERIMRRAGGATFYFPRRRPLDPAAVCTVVAAGTSPRELADRLGVTPSRIRQIVRRGGARGHPSEESVLDRTLLGKRPRG
jgi:Mor family transcriptional regulator